MADICINRENLNYILDTYSQEDTTYRIIEKFPKKGNSNAETCKFILAGNECTIDIFYKKDGTKLIPVGKNIDTANILIEHVSLKGLNANIESKQMVIITNSDFADEMQGYFDMNYTNIVKVEKAGNKYVFQGCNLDKVTIHQYKDKIMIQGKPLYVFSLIMDYIANVADVAFEDYYEKYSDFVGSDMSFTSIRSYMQSDLGELYNYLDEALLKTLASSIILLNQNKNNSIGDFSGCLTGSFKTLEGFMKKILSQKYKYKFSRQGKFDMFDKINGAFIVKRGSVSASQEECKCLESLYTLFNNKRNTYLHAKINPAMTSNIESYIEAKSIYEQIIDELKYAYNVFYGVQNERV